MALGNDQRKAKGSVVIEAVMILFSFVLMHILLFETARRGVLQLVLVHLVCEEARARSLGEDRNTTLSKSVEFVEQALSSSIAKWIHHQASPRFYTLFEVPILTRLRLNPEGGGVSERYLRYPQFLSFQMRNQKQKHHQELLVRCLFPFS